MNRENMGKTMKYRYLIFGILGLGYIVVYFHRLCPAVLAVDMMADLKAGGTLIGLLGSAYFYPYAVMQLPAGLLSDSWGARKSVTIFLVIAFSGSVLMGLAPSSFWAIAGRALTGLGVSILFVPTMKILSEWFDAKEFAVMSGFLIAIGGIGSLASATPLAWLSSWIGWRMSFVAVGCATLVVSFLVWVVVRDRPQDMGWPSPVVKTSADTHTLGLWEGVKTVLGHPGFWPVAVWFFFDAGVFFALGGLWGGPYLMQVYHLEKSQAGDILAMLFLWHDHRQPGAELLFKPDFQRQKTGAYHVRLHVKPDHFHTLHENRDPFPLAVVCTVFRHRCICKRSGGHRIYNHKGIVPGVHIRDRHWSGEPVSLSGRRPAPAFYRVYTGKKRYHKRGLCH